MNGDKTPLTSKTAWGIIGVLYSKFQAVSDGGEADPEAAANLFQQFNGFAGEWGITIAALVIFWGLRTANKGIRYTKTPPA